MSFLSGPVASRFWRMTAVCALTTASSSSRWFTWASSASEMSSANVTVALYFVISPNCLSMMSLMASDRPSPVSSSAVQPAMPMTVMMKRFL